MGRHPGGRSRLISKKPQFPGRHRAARIPDRSRASSSCTFPQASRGVVTRTSTATGQGQTATKLRRPRLLIAEPHEGLRCALARFLEADYEVVAAVADETDLARAARTTSPDVTLSDETLLPAAIRWARNRGRRQRLAGGIVVLGRHDAPALWSRRVPDGRAGCVPKWKAATELGPAIQAALGRAASPRNP